MNNKNDKLLYKNKTNPVWGILLQLICLLLIILIVFHYHENPLLSTILISILLIVFFLRAETITKVYDDRIVFSKKRTFKFISSDYMVFFDDISNLEIDKAEIFYPGFLLGATSANLSIKNASLIIHFRNGTFKKVILWGKTKKYYKMLELALERINK